MFRIDFNKLRFLVCDDNPHMRRILRTLLHSFGAREVYESEDGATALEEIVHKEVSAVERAFGSNEERIRSEARVKRQREKLRQQILQEPQPHAPMA